MAAADAVSVVERKSRLERLVRSFIGQSCGLSEASFYGIVLMMQQFVNGQHRIELRVLDMFYGRNSLPFDWGWQYSAESQ